MPGTTISMPRDRETVVLSLGGSLVAPGEIDVAYLKRFRQLVLGQLKTRRFAVYVGGGKIARKYQLAASELGAPDVERDWLGIFVTRLNANLVKLLFGRKAHPIIVENPTKKVRLKQDVLVAAGWKPGWSTDYDSVLLAKNLGSKIIINLTNVDYVYDKDPRKYPNAIAFENLSWPEFKKIIGGKWSPGLSTPFDPIAAKEASRLGMKVIIMNGTNLQNLESFFLGKPFVGTTIG